MRGTRALAVMLGLGAVGGTAIAWGGSGVSRAPMPPPEIVVGSNVLVSRDGDFAHLETPIAASPVGPNLLIAAGTVYGSDGPAHDRAYVSTDRGITWHTVTFPGPRIHGSFDPMVEIGPTGTLYFATIDSKVGNVAYRSVDSGSTWEGPVRAAVGDRANLAVDRTGGRFGGRVYWSGGGSWEGKGGTVVYYSDDDGRTYRAGGLACLMKGWGPPPLILSDGTLFVICSESSAEEFGFAVSSDGGKTFTPYRVIGHRPSVIGSPAYARAYAENRYLLIGYAGLMCAVDAHTDAYRDRIYCAWTHINPDSLVARIHFSFSSDKGQTWSAPRAIDATRPTWATQAQPSIAVNRDGIVGVAWFDTRASRTGDRYDVHFTASRDGGATFLTPVRVSSASSLPMGPGNLRPTTGAPVPWAKPREAAQPETYLAGSGFTSRSQGGDYVGMTVDTEGEFHSVWPDARSGTWQLYTARIRVARTGETFARVRPDTAQLRRTPLGDRTVLAFDPSAIDTAAGEVTLWARVRNTSPDTLYGPFAVEVVELAPPFELGFPGRREASFPWPTPVNASNGRRGVGARFDYAGTAGTLDLLPPGAVSEALPWRFRIRHPLWTSVQMKAVVSGFVRK